MKRIGILTFHRAHNYGAVLQAYALQECLTRLGVEVCFIDYKDNDLLDVYKLLSMDRIKSKNPFKLIRNVKREIDTFSGRTKRSTAFNRFINNKLKIDVNVGFDYINNHFDIIFIGSDQVWNFHLTSGFDPYYWGAFKDRKSKLVLASYAASMEVSNLSEIEELQISKLLKNFNIISVREDSLKNALTKLTDQKISVVADPTLLLDENIWNNLAVSPKREKPYLLLYQVRNNSKNEYLAKKIAKERNLEIIYLSASLESINSKECVGASPEEYLGWFKNAEIVLCSSFHGIIFSIIFKVPFYSIFMNDGRDSRALSLLGTLNLLDRVIYNEDNINYKSIINWENVRLNMDNIKSNSIGFVKGVLK